LKRDLFAPQRTISAGNPHGCWLGPVVKLHSY
jgi:hypothetical protein